MAIYDSYGTKISEAEGGNVALPSREKLEELRRIADAAEQRAEIAEQEAKSAKKQSWISTGLSILAIIVSLADIIVSIILR